MFLRSLCLRYIFSLFLSLNDEKGGGGLTIPGLGENWKILGLGGVSVLSQFFMLGGCQ